jgi:hypothetical protein
MARHLSSRAALLIAVATCFAVFLTACAHKKPAPTASPGERGPATGVALYTMVIDDDPFDDNLSVGEAPRTFAKSTKPLAEVLSAYANRVIPVTPATRTLWRANGLRLISVPRRDLDYLKETLRLVGPVEQQGVVESVSWKPAARSPGWDQTQSVSLDDGPLPLAPGYLRLLMRCWAAPASALANTQIASDPSRRLESGSLAGAIQLELVPQQVGRASRSEFAAALEPKRSIEAEGVVLTRLLLEASLTTDDLLLIIPERPDAEWRTHDAPPQAPGSHPLGPPVPTPPTLGEMMLTDLATGGHRNLRRILIIAPSPPRKYNLLAAK